MINLRRTNTTPFDKYIIFYRADGSSFRIPHFSNPQSTIKQYTAKGFTLEPINTPDVKERIIEQIEPTNTPIKRGGRPKKEK